MNGATDSNPGDIMALFYKRVDPYLYGCVQCFRLSDDKPIVKPYRQSAPFVISQSVGNSKEFVYGSVFELIREIRCLMADLGNCQHKLRSQLRRSGVKTSEMPDSSGRTVRVTLPSGDSTNEIFLEYIREITNLLLLISCQTRNLFEIFPRLNAELVSLLDYEGKEVEKVRVKEIFDSFVHNRYLFVDGEHVTDLFSDKLATKSSISNLFMGYKISWREYVAAIQQALDDVKIRDITGLLRGRLKSLSPDSSHKDIVFLIQNLESLSKILAEKIPTGKYASMLNLLFDEAIKLKLPSMRGRGPVNISVRFAAPHIKIHEKLSEKKFKIQVRCRFSVGKKKSRSHGNEKLEDFSKEVGYEEFFEHANNVFGSDQLVKEA